MSDTKHKEEKLKHTAERASMEKEVVESLWNGNTEMQIQAAVELRKLSRKQRHNLVESGVMVPLISMLHYENYEAIEAALCALLSLAFGSERLVHLSHIFLSVRIEYSTKRFTALKHSAQPIKLDLFYSLYPNMTSNVKS